MRRDEDRSCRPRRPSPLGEWVTPATSARSQDCNRVDVSVQQDSCGSVASASVTGDARGEDCQGPASCVTVSGTGDASNQAGDESCGNAGLGGIVVGCIAASGTGNASNSAGEDSCQFPASWVAVSVQDLINEHLPDG